jgi:hypothetical protein
MIGHQLIRKDSERKQSSRAVRKTSVGIAGVLTKIQTKHHLNSSPEYYHHINLPSTDNVDSIHHSFIFVHPSLRTYNVGCYSYINTVYQPCKLQACGTWNKQLLCAIFHNTAKLKLLPQKVANLFSIQSGKATKNC